MVATKKNIGKTIKTKTIKTKIISVKEALQKKPNYTLFSAGSKTANKYAKMFVKVGSTVIDNSSAFRMKPTIKLIVPEINKSIINKKDKIIANPNCSTIQMVLAINKIHKKYKIKRIIVSTYQAVSGSGNKGIQQLKQEEKNQKSKTKAYKKQIFQNIIPQCDKFEKNPNWKSDQPVKVKLI